MTTIIVGLIAIAGIAAFVTLWFMVVWRELRQRLDTVISAEKQLAVCERNELRARGDPKEEQLAEMLRRSRDIYLQALQHYNGILKRPWYRIPGVILGYSQCKARINQ